MSFNRFPQLSLGRPQPVGESLRAGLVARRAEIVALALAAAAGLALARLGIKRFSEVEAICIAVLLGWWRVELAYVAVFAVAFLGGSINALNHWNTVAPALVVFIAVRELAVGKKPLIAWPLVAYAVSFALAILGGVNPGSGIAAIQYLLGPALAFVTAWACRSERLRQRLVMLIVAGALIEFVLVLLQAVTNLNLYGGSRYAQFADGITGGAGVSGSGRVMDISVMAAVILVAMLFERVGKRPLLLIACAALLSVGALNGAKAVFFMAPVAIGGVVLASGVRRRAGRWTRRLLGGLGLAVVAICLLFVSQSLYPGSTQTLSSVSTLQNYLFGIQPQQQQYGALPPRGVLLENGLALMHQDGAVQSIFGHGLGATKPQALNGINLPTSANLFLTGAQESNGFWVTRLAIETGYVGLGVWFLFLLWLPLLGRRVRRRARPGSLDAAIGLALYGFAPFFLIDTFYDTAPVSDVTAAAFWTLVGLAIAVAYGKTGQSRSGGALEREPASLGGWPESSRTADDRVVV